jgi:fructuronate reductase
VSSARRFSSAPQLTRAALAAVTGAREQAPPVRIVHIGLGAFHRAHQAWYTDHAADGADWGIAAFTGRSPEMALELAPQDGLFTLIERAADGDSASVITSIAEAVDGADVDRFVALLSRRSTAIVTLTVTEAGYRLDGEGHPDPSDLLLAGDIEWLASAVGREQLLDAVGDRPRTALGRLLLGFEARRRAAAGPIAVVPCDNVPNNGEFVARGLKAIARAIDSELAAWVDENAAFVSTSVDRITPKTTAEDRLTAASLTGWRDRSPVVTEPFADWVLSGEFPAGRPEWESAGARFVVDIEPFERRKLWLLNGAHSLLAYSGLLRGHATVAQALADPVCSDWVNDLWDEAARHLPTAELELDTYRAALLHRFANPRIAYQLTQIATDGVAKLGVRVAPLVLAERAEGRDGGAGIRALASWIQLVLAGYEFSDTASAAVGSARREPRKQAVEELTRLVEPRLLEDPGAMAAIAHLALPHSQE